MNDFAAMYLYEKIEETPYKCAQIAGRRKFCQFIGDTLKRDDYALLLGLYFNHDIDKIEKLMTADTKLKTLKEFEKTLYLESRKIERGK